MKFNSFSLRKSKSIFLMIVFDLLDCGFNKLRPFYVELLYISLLQKIHNQISFTRKSLYHQILKQSFFDIV